jgi:hypothetical protein
VGQDPRPEEDLALADAVQVSVQLQYLDLGGRGRRGGERLLHTAYATAHRW